MLLASREVAKVFGVSPETVRIWERKGKLPKAALTPANHRRWDSDLLIPIMRALALPVPAEWLRSSEAAA